LAPQGRTKRKNKGIFENGKSFMDLSAQLVEEQDLEYIVQNCATELESIRNQRLLLTGCAGFLGYYLSKAIIFFNNSSSEKIDLTIQDNFFRGKPNWISELHAESWLKIETKDVLTEYSNFNFHNVIHAASIASPIFYRKYPIETMDANVRGLRNLLDNQKSFKLRTDEPTNFLYFSTSEIYGDPDPKQIPTAETYRGNVSCTGPRACYDESKRYGETLCVNFWKQYGHRTVIVRPFNNYGPGLKLSDGRAVSDFCQSLIEQNSIELLSDGTPTRTFCYIADAVCGYIKAMVKGKDSEAYNIGNEKPEISMLNLAKLFATEFEKITGNKASLSFRDSNDSNYLIDNPNRRCPNIKKAKLELNFQPNYELQKGVQNTLAWYLDLKK
jgi:UDP-glucuronate decarboxylase